MCTPEASELAVLTVASNGPLGAKLGCQGALGRQVGLPRGTRASGAGCGTHFSPGAECGTHFSSPE